jgi:RES domain-containing protein
MLEVLAHANIGRIPDSQRFVVVDVPDNMSIEHVDEFDLPSGWDSESSTTARVIGDRWLMEARSAILIVPSVVARIDQNAVINPLHPDIAQLIVSEPQKVMWDKRLFERFNQR